MVDQTSCHGLLLHVVVAVALHWVVLVAAVRMVDDLCNLAAVVGNMDVRDRRHSWAGVGMTVVVNSAEIV